MKTVKLALSICFCTILSALATPSLLNMPTGSKIIFKQDIIIPPAETSVLIGSSKDGYTTECYLTMKGFDNALRKIPKGTEYSVKDTKESFGNQVSLVLESQSLNTIACSSTKPWYNNQPIPENYLAYTTVAQAQKALNGKIELKVNTEPKIVKD